ncbi:glycosyltransferase family 4 protein [Kribbia dieselivorans]|uniref:glycosyltransferase family 4 protein n=1 Tax=Kribbia dieselivorans TaxID=331526 RepID=UPI0008390458|nr:glycosyltransferase family 4 protein [Kribbia dieselivorans]
MRISLISSSFHPYPGGVEEHTRHVARELVARGHEVVVWTVDRGEHLGVRTVDGIIVRYLPTPLPARQAGALARAALTVPSALVKWLAAYRDDRPEILNVQCFGPNGVYAQAVAALTRTPLVISAHGETFMDDHSLFDESALARTALRRGLRRADVVTGASELVLDDLRARFGLTGGDVVANGVDLNEPERLRGGGDRVDKEPTTIVAVGRVERVKGFDLLLDAFAASGLAAEGARLVIGGDGGALADLIKKAADLGITDTVEFPGRLDRRGVIDLMTRAGVVVVPSRREAFGIVALEAWRAGAVLVATSLGGPATFVRDGVDGLIVDPTDSTALGSALRRAVDDGELAARLSQAGRDRVTEFTWDRVAADYEKVFARARARRR